MRFGIQADTDGLLAAGQPGYALTWMDARVDGRPATPRIGKPVEVQALWINALRIGAEEDARWRRLFEQATASFERRFWNESAGCLRDVVDVDHVAGTVDDSIRPNQIFAVGGLPFPLLGGEKARRVVETVERHLLTPVGLRTLAPFEPGYAAHYEGGPAERDAVYHQGTVWPWLTGAFVEAWLRVRDHSPAARAEARRRFLPIMQTTAEIADAAPPHILRGCPFQAWSVGERLRLEALLA
jgi:predicted glycogen debranching enzyme